MGRGGALLHSRPVLCVCAIREFFPTLGESLAKGDPDGAISAYRQALETNPKYAGVHNNLGLALQDKGDFDGAFAAFQKRSTSTPSMKWHTITSAALQAKGTRMRHSCSTHGSRNPPLEPAGLLYSGPRLYRKRGYRQCYRRLSPGAVGDPRFAMAQSNLGMALKKKGDVDGALAAYRQAIASDPKLKQAHNNLGFVLQDKGDVAGAIAAYRTALDIDPRYAKAHNNLGDALLTTGDISGALQAFRQALANDPKLVVAHINLGKALQRKASYRAPPPPTARPSTSIPRMQECTLRPGPCPAGTG